MRRVCCVSEFIPTGACFFFFFFFFLLGVLCKGRVGSRNHRSHSTRISKLYHHHSYRRSILSRNTANALLAPKNLSRKRNPLSSTKALPLLLSLSFSSFLHAATLALPCARSLASAISVAATHSRRSRPKVLPPLFLIIRIIVHIIPWAVGGRLGCEGRTDAAEDDLC